MVIPIPASAMASGASVPLSLVSPMRWIFGSVLVLEVLLAAARLYMVDIAGGLILLLVAGFGGFVVKYDFDLQWTIMFGITMCINGVFNFAKLLEILIVNWGNFPAPFSSDNPRAFVGEIIVIMAPVLDWTLAGLCAYIYRKSVYSTTNYSVVEERRPILTRAGTGFSSVGGSSAFTPFSGQGHKLG